MKKTIVLISLLSLVLMFSVGTVAYAAEPQAVSPTQPAIDGTTITVDSVEDLLWVTGYSAGEYSLIDNIPVTFLNCTINVTADIDMSEIDNWTPITDFHGTLQGAKADGSNAVISHMTVNYPDREGVGLCGNISFTGGKPYFSKITIADSTVYTQLAYAGAFVGNGYTAQFDYCYVQDTHVTGLQYIGGLVGTTYGNITNCKVESTTNSLNTQVTIYGTHSILSQQGDNAGGIVGLMGEGGGTISYCTVRYALVEGARQIGGIAGNLQYGNTVSNCNVEYSTISSNGTGLSLFPPAVPAVGGIVGEARGASSGTTPITLTDNTVSYCTLTKVVSGAYVGWFVGALYRVDLGTTLISSGNSVVEPQGTNWPEYGN